MPQSDIWATATGEDGGLPVIYRFRQNKPRSADAARYPSALRVVWEYDVAARNGMPPDRINELQIGFEDPIDALGDGDSGYLMLVFTGNGRKEWFYYVADPAEWVDRLNSRLSDHEPYPLQIEDWPDENWSVWQSFVDSLTSPDNSRERGEQRI